MKTKIFSLILCFVMVFSLVLTACGTEGDTEKTGDVGGGVVRTAEQKDPNDIYDQEIKDLKNHEFLFVTQETTTSHLRANEVASEALNGDKVNDAVFKRNSAIQKDYNCIISEERTDSVLNTVREPLIAGEYIYDVIYGRTINLRTLSASGLMVDFTTLENIQLEKNWWDHNMHEGLAIAGHLFYVNGELSTLDDRSSIVMFFNRDMMDKNDLENPFDLVKAGTWTIDKLYELSEACAVDDDGDGVWTPGKDTFAYLSPDFDKYTYIASAHLYLGDQNSDGTFSLPGTVRKDILNTWTKLRPLLTSPHRDVSDSGSRFRNGKAAFYTMNLGSLLNYNDTTISFGILPIPKIDESQAEYGTTVSSAINYSFGIPATVDNTTDAAAAGFTSGREMVAYFLNALCYRSRDTLTTAFFDQVLKHQMIRDEVSIEMLDLALKNKMYDPIVFFNFGAIGYIFRDAGSNGSGGTRGTVGAVGTDVNYDTLVSLYDARLAAARKALNNYLKYLDQLDENANADL